MIVLGIDPGLGGALAVYVEHNKKLLSVWDTPVYKIESKRKLNLSGLNMLFKLDLPKIDLAILENVHSMPKQSAQSGFTFGGVFLATQALLVANNIPYVLVSPQMWKKRMRVTKDKDSCRQLATQLFPDSAHQWKLKNQADRAEAALLAVYGALL